jgi:hypothetical protein
MKKFREIINCFSLDLEETTIKKSDLNTNIVNRF